MLESIISPKKAERRPWEMFFIGLLYSLVAVFVVDLIFMKNVSFSQHSGILIVIFTVMLCIPFMYFLIKYEEKKSLVIDKEKTLLKEHGKALKAFAWLFLGTIIGFFLAFILLPSNITAINFDTQLRTYCNINMPSNVENCVKNFGAGFTEKGQVPGFGVGLQRVVQILTNNFFVLLFALLFSFVFGFGAIFILVWNSSVIATAMGIFVKGTLARIPLSFLRYLVHGVPEMLSYFIAALGGGIIAIAVIRHHYKEKNFWNVLQDSINLIIIAIVLLIISAFMEVFLTPLLF